MTNHIKEMAMSETRTDALREFLLFILTLLISTFLIRVLWNRSLAKHISVLRPISTLGDAFFLSVALSAIRGL